MKQPTMKLSSSQAKWLRRFVFNRRDGQSYRSMYDESFSKYCELGGTQPKQKYTNFLSRCVGSRNVVASLPEKEAVIALQSVGLTTSELFVIDEVMRDIKLENVSPVSDAEEEFFRACAILLWTKNAECSKNHELDMQEPLLKLLDSIIEHTEVFLHGQKEIIFRELFDFLVENRQYERWERWIEAISREYRRYFCVHLQKDCSDWFPGCIIREDGSVIIDAKTVNDLERNDLDEMAFLVSCRNMDINSIRHAVFCHTIQIERLTAKIAKLKNDPNADPSEIANAEFDVKEHRVAKVRGKGLLRIAFREVRRYIKPVWDKMKDANNPDRWFFLLQCTRLFYDFARYHYYSSLKIDKAEAIDIYHEIISLAHKVVDDTEVDNVVKCRFDYLASTACRYIAEYKSSTPYHAMSYVKEAMRFAGESVDRLRNNYSRLPSQTRKALEYRFTRHLGRITTFAIRWWLKHGCPIALFENPVASDNDNDSRLSFAEKCYYDSVCQPLGLDEGREGSVRILTGKRKLEWEFHLRVQIEMLVYEFDRFIRDTQADVRKDRIALCNPLIDAEKALCLIVSIYCYLFSARRGESEEHRPFTHISRDVESYAIKWLDECGEESEFLQFDYKHLQGIQQAEPPSLTCQLETLCTIMHVFDRHETHAPQLFKILEEYLSDPDLEEAHVRFRDRVWLPVKDALEKDKLNILHIYQYEANEFGKVTKINYKEYPLYRHRFEMVYGPGSNALDIDRMLVRLGLVWNPAKMEVVT